MKNIIADVFDLLEQAVINATHRDCGDECRPIFEGQAFLCAPVVLASAPTFETHQRPEPIVDDAKRQFLLGIPKVPQILQRKVNAPT